MARVAVAIATAIAAVAITAHAGCAPKTKSAVTNDAALRFFMTRHPKN
jgi:hypothetical protein